VSILELVFSLSAVFLLSGAIKGAVGIGLPTAAVGILTLFLAPRTAIAYMLLPMITANLWQVYRQGDAWLTVKRYMPFWLVLILVLTVTVTLSQGLSDKWLMAVLGMVIVAFVLMSLLNLTLRVSDAANKTAQQVAGGLGGLLGGLVGLWSPPMVAYLHGRGVSKEEFVRASGVLLLIGSIPLTFGYIFNGYLNLNTGGVSALLIIPTFMGFALGEHLRRYLSEARFRQLLLALFLLMGLNLIRRAFT